MIWIYPACCCFGYLGEAPDSKLVGILYKAFRGDLKRKCSVAKELRPEIQNCMLNDRRCSDQVWVSGQSLRTSVAQCDRICGRCPGGLSISGPGRVSHNVSQGHRMQERLARTLSSNACAKGWRRVRSPQDRVAKHIR